MTASRKRFSQEFKDELCREVINTSKPIKDVATAYGVGPETLRNWLVKYRAANGGTEVDLTVSERARLKELEREVQELRAGTAFLKKPALTSRGSKRSVAISSNLHPAGFDELMPKTLATATVDRLLHHAHVCQTSGDSIRLTQALAGKGVTQLN
jgi:transposase